MKRPNRQGALRLSAGALVGMNTIPKLSRATGIPESTLRRDLMEDFSGMTTGRLLAVIRATHMKHETILEVMKA